MAPGAGRASCQPWDRAQPQAQSMAGAPSPSTAPCPEIVKLVMFICTFFSPGNIVNVRSCSSKLGLFLLWIPFMEELNPWIRKEQKDHTLPREAQLEKNEGEGKTQTVNKTFLLVRWRMFARKCPLCRRSGRSWSLQPQSCWVSPTFGCGQEKPTGCHTQTSSGGAPNFTVHFLFPADEDQGA